MAAEIERVASTIKGFFEASGEEQIEKLVGVIERCIQLASTRAVEHKIEDEAVRARIKEADSALKDLMKNLPEGREEKKERFTEVAIQAMTARRATYPLTNAERPWFPPTPEEAIRDDDDPYTFAIFDTVADDLAEHLPAIYQLAVEGDWDADVPNHESTDDGD
jgi:chemotaxis protein histidine kinase CheA